MFGSSVRTVVRLAATLGMVGVIAAHADDTGFNGVLSKNGLTRAHGLYILKEPESEARQKLAEMQSRYKDLSMSYNQQMEFEYEAIQIQELTQQSNVLKNALNQYNRALGGGRRGRYGNSMVNGELSAERVMVQQNYAMATQQLQMLKGRVPSAKIKKDLSDRIGKQRLELEGAVNELRTAVDSVVDKYDTLAKDEAIKSALNAASDTPVKPKLGPSKEFHDMVKTLEKMERALKTGTVKPTASKKKSKTTKSAKGSAKSAFDS